MDAQSQANADTEPEGEQEVASTPVSVSGSEKRGAASRRATIGRGGSRPVTSTSEAELAEAPAGGSKTKAVGARAGGGKAAAMNEAAAELAEAPVRGSRAKAAGAKAEAAKAGGAKAAVVAEAAEAPVDPPSAPASSRKRLTAATILDATPAPDTPSVASTADDAGSDAGAIRRTSRRVAKGETEPSVSEPSVQQAPAKRSRARQ